ncbi:glutathione S-transferase family protein [Pseudomonas duriflava]|uniref:glutathione S-transferase family protein n=1 Tax=Pseudomonas duriflava TaxID=459528 RepID=UPI0011A98295|nr:glutathione S-transferase family protein [Pseudomonas duriflava]
MLLYDLERSGNCYKIRLLLSLLGITYQKTSVDLNAGEGQQPEFLALNPRGQVPVLVDNDTTLWDSTAILVYLARQYGRGLWLPTDPVGMAKVMQWLSFEQNEGRYGLGRARAITLNSPTLLARTGNLEDSQALALIGLDVLEKQLTGNEWLVPEAGGPTLADIACYPYTALAPEGGIDLEPFVAIKRWLTRMRTLPGYIELP